MIEYEKIKPCPFCGNKVFIAYRSNTGSYWVSHCHCDKSNSCFDTMTIYDVASLADAKKLWNRRSGIND